MKEKRQGKNKSGRGVRKRRSVGKGMGPKDVRINLYKFISGEKGKGVVRKIERIIVRQTGLLRKSVRATLNWLVANLVDLPRDAWIYYPRDRNFYAVEVPKHLKKTGRYGQHLSHGNVVKITRGLEKNGLVKNEMGSFASGLRSRLKPTNKFWTLFSNRGSTKTREMEHEVILLRGRKKGKKLPARCLDYKDNGHTNATRSKVRRINKVNDQHNWRLEVNIEEIRTRIKNITPLIKAPTGYLPASPFYNSKRFCRVFDCERLEIEDLSPLECCENALWGFRDGDAIEKVISEGRLSLKLDVQCYRVFNENFSRGGRFYGTDVLRLKNRELKLRECVTVDGESTIELDFGAMHPRMLYHNEGLEAPRDPYIIPGRDDLRLPFKLLALICFNAKNRTIAMRAFRKNLRERNISLPDGIKVGDLASAFERENSPIRHKFYSGCGLYLQNIDSKIAERVMYKFAKMGRPITGVHDSFLVRASDCELLRTTMRESYMKEMKGFEPSIK